MRCSASSMFARNTVNYCTCVICKSIYSLITTIDTSLNPIVKIIVGAMCIVRRPSITVTSESHYCIICSFYFSPQHHVFVVGLILYGHIVGLHVCIYIV